MNLNFIGQIVVPIAVVLIPIIAAWLTRIATKYLKNTDVLNAIEKLAKSAVAVAEKTGIAQSLVGSEQFQLAVKSVQDGLKALGITDADLSIIEDQVEKAYADAKIQLDTVYKDSDSAKASIKLQQAQDILDQADAVKAQTEAAQAQIVSAQKALTDAMTNSVPDGASTSAAH